MSKAGNWVARFESRNAEGQTVEALATFKVIRPGENERTDLLVLADRTDYFAGEEAKLTLLSPIEAQTALLCVEADRVLHWRTLRLERGQTTLTLPVEASWMPNVRISVTAISGERSFRGECQLSARKLLKLEIKTDKQDYKPGETVQVSIVATDSLGRPVEAEVALAAVDESIFDLEPEKTGSIRAAFYNIVRQLAVRTGTSLGWEYPGTVSEIDPDIMNDSRTRDRAMAKDAEELGARLAERMEAARENNDAMSDELRRNFRPADDPAPAPAAPGFNSSTGMGGNLGGGGGPGGQGGFTYRRARGGGGMRADSIDLLQALNARADFRLTAGWLPAIHTGKDGKATASFKLPENVGSWRLTAHGITTDTHVGEARGKITTKLPFYGEVDAPRLCVEGDRFAIGAQFVNETGEAGKVSVTLGEERRRTPGEGSPSVIEVAVDRTRATGLGLSLDGVLDSLLGANLRVRPGAFTQTGNDAPTAVIVGADADQLMKVIIGKRADGANVLVKDIAVLRQVTAGPAPSVTIDRDTKNGEAAWISSQWLAEQAGEVDLMALGSIGGNVDSLRRKIVIQPFGDPSSSGFSGTLQADGRASHIVQLPDNAVPYATVLVVQVTPSMADSLLDSLDYLKEYPYGCIEQTVNRFFPALAVFSAISDLQHRDPKLARECFAIAEDGLARMLGHQAQDGGWGWWGTGARNPQLTALCYEALVTSRRMDLPVPDDALIRARDWLVRYIRDSREAAPDRAMMSVLMALATPGDRRSVTPPSNLKAMIARYQAAIMQGTADIVARASIAWSRLNDMASAQAAADALAALALRDGNTAHWTAGAAQQSYGGSDVETTALALQALAMAKRDTTLQESAVEWLEASKGPNGKGQWRATRDTAMVVQAYAAYMQGRRLTSTDGTILVSVNGAKVGEIKLGTIDGTRNHTLMLRGTQGLKAGNNQVQLSCDSTVRPRYHGTLRTIVPAEQIAAVSNHGLRISRRYIPATRGVDASQVFERNPGNSPADVAAEGDFVDVLIEMSSTQVRDEVMIEEPIPAGFEPITSTMQGVNGTSPQRIEHRPGKVVMFYDQLPAGTTSVRFRARAVRPGRYRVLPGNVSMMYFPEINAHGADAAFTILSGSEWTSRVEATPAWRAAALVNTAQAAMASHDAAAERKAWGELLAFNGLRRSIHEQALQRLLILSLDRGDLAEAKNWLVNLATSRHSFPALDIRQSVLAADAWKGTEPMQALAWYRSAMSQVYDAERQTVDLSVTPAERAETLRMMLTRYPDMARLTHDMADQAVMATAAAPADKRSAVYIAAMKRLAAEEPTGYWNRLAMMNICEHLFQIGKHTEARDLGRQWLATLDPATEPLADNVTYLVAITSFALGEYDVAREYAKKLVDTRYATPPSGYGAQDRHQYFVNADERNEWKRRSVWAPNWSENRPKAALILGQLAHADGNLADAVKWYTMARSDSQDAQLALNELTGEELGVPAFVMAKPGEAAQLEVTGRNVPKATVAVYPFDLLYCFTVRKHLRELHTIDLTGLRAERELEVELESKPYARYT
ncbi:MAG: alpha-2-macroglobulin family protein, partial [Planctomycetota bacterium]